MFSRNVFEKLMALSRILIASGQRVRPIMQRGGSMVGARIAGMAFGAAGSIWAARCLGPENLGISGFIISISTQVILLFAVLQQTVLVRNYMSATSDQVRQELVTAATTFYCASSLVISVIITCALVTGFISKPYSDLVAFLILIIFASALQPTWLFQATEKQQFQSIVSVLQPFLQGLFYWIYFRPGMSAGADLVVIAVVSALVTTCYWIALFRLHVINYVPISLRMLGKISILLKQSRWYFILSVAVYIYTTLEMPMIGWLRSLDELGQYRTAFTLTGAAKAFFDIIPAILFPRFVEWRRASEELLWKRQCQLVAVFLPLGVIGSGVAFLLMPYVYSTLYGDVFLPAAIPCAVLVCSKFVVMVNGIFFWGLATDSTSDRKMALWMIGIAVISLISNMVFIPEFGMLGSSLINLFSEILILALCWCMSYRRMARIRKITAREGDRHGI